MDVVLSIAQFLVNEILAVPAYLIGIITAIGMAALGKGIGQVLGSAIKATLGFLLIGAGAGLVTASLEPLGVMIEGATGMRGVVPTNEAIAGIAQAEYGSQVAWLMILGFAVSLLLARFTPLSYVFLTGHHVLFMATMLTIILATTGYSTWVVVVVGAILLGILMVSLPAIAHPWTRRITGNDSIAIGHFGTLGYVAAAATGKAVGGKKAKQSPSTEDLKLPEGLRFLRDSMVSTALSMAIMYIILALLFLARAGKEEAFTAFADGATDVGNFIMQSVTQGLQFGVAVAVILFGVRTILGELVPAFQGIAAKVVPGAIPALDAPIVFPYAQNAVLIGFISSFIGGLTGLALLAVWLNPMFGVALILPGLVPHFFTGGAAGVYGNATGGRRGAMLGAFVNGLIITILPAFLLGVLGTFGDANTTFGDADFGWFGILVGWSAQLGGALGIILCALIGIAVLALGWWSQRKLVDANWDPTPWRESPAGAAEAAGDPNAATGDGAAKSVSSGLTAASAKYPKVAPPQGAPVPPAPQY
ncbi:PTS ascorbate transporter subunit IIC [Corynebacterium ammoniagenes]|uniref:Ascorbate-specific PTS system EIIC component n=2 Tax=Corynebacterium ammoniagenes TaxID=1697 RepID=A0AAV5G7F6_CORAM|nr:PTS ascorbate transporter subunit IIC [Corynebacterium ammoniagenes]APT82234.1 PTS ascorbate transporter subunit IIC [Corynebacterium ammoniagenes DSM 20306]AQS73330.1 PTS ascorbate transporter subunit IIC [Corynebacterium ammoniagenes]EFG80181.1 putative sugar-specific permease, SgaT/UlaA [Corynebacterium ammoniagenes DSM 20306]GJN42060.1 PTS ascorbate transporter subunit IIC [Corynebacterium ammoniagenes]